MFLPMVLMCKTAKQLPRLSDCLTGHPCRTVLLSDSVCICTMSSIMWMRQEFKISTKQARTVNHDY